MIGFIWLAVCNISKASYFVKSNSMWIGVVEWLVEAWTMMRFEEATRREEHIIALEVIIEDASLKSEF